MPFFARWPGHIAPGTRYDMPVQHIDILPTAAAAAGAQLPDDHSHTIDGVDVLPFVRGERTGAPHETLFWREGYHQAVLHDGWKLIVSGIPDRKWLFHLSDNPTEHQDLAAMHPEIVAQLQALLDAHNAEQAAPMWPSVIESPQLIDKTGADPYVAGRRLHLLAQLRRAATDTGAVFGEPLPRLTEYGLLRQCTIVSCCGLSVRRRSHHKRRAFRHPDPR